MERRSFLKGLFGTAAAVAIPTGVVKASEVVNKIENKQKISERMNLRSIESELYNQFVRKINTSVGKLNPLLDTMWKSVTKGKFISHEIATEIRYHFDEIYRLSNDLKQLSKNGKFENSYWITESILGMCGRQRDENNFVYAISYISEGDYDSAQYHINENVRNGFSKWCGNIYLRYKQTDLAIHQYEIAISDGASIKRFVGNLKKGNKVKLPPMYEIHSHCKQPHTYSEL